MKRTVLGLDVRRHPWAAGQLWAALVWAAFLAIGVLRGQYLSLEKLGTLAGLLLLGGVAFGAAMSVLAAKDREER